MASEMKEKCGVFGVFNHPKAADLTYYGLHALQHRGQESAGIVVSDGKTFKHHRGMGLVTQVFSRDILDGMSGNMAIGHVRYSTSGESLLQNAQPLVFKYSGGDLAVAHNGNLVNARIERNVLQQQGSIFQTTTDTEIIAHLIARSSKNGFEEAAPDILTRIDGSFALLIMTEKQMLIALDRHGLRPLSLGRIGEAVIAASETCALNAVNAEFWRDVEPGEWLLIDENGVRTGRFAPKSELSLCSFEFVYFARPDSVIHGRSILSIRKELGKILAKEHPIQADVVVAVPDSSIPAAIGFAQELGVPYEMGLIKNPYVGRSFIEPTQELRELAVRLKLSAVQEILEGKRVVLVDDSIVRGTTSKRIVQLIRQAGAKEVHVRISSPMVRNPCFYGVDMPTKEELFANRLEHEEAMGEAIGADTLAFLSTEGLLKAVDVNLAETSNRCIACFSGAYPTNLYLK
ncbi:amidophosphoribosyltransferase [Domibacillus sp. DTU_2020_1001157_1_SI_ALB_TIR_016]|uniref:amidophosphoribosyltransferase n=1 Tax=Domibacillus sp. DTU_2020_1001157_1_SI_ALB_TIR_016 TaxID=3077789 RepID=UPI0028E77CBF|nr:amidophosphoribosyltransferase [Domibacillus sp. DTU_2020_1001157_1_SI_ALB_TIR_016]WNS82265.1 amidophosphoribosyltransferase [Domibacillus sp. DTU_2020_1001157_1_SI_ALB_TIR_016]